MLGGAESESWRFELSGDLVEVELAEGRSGVLCTLILVYSVALQLLEDVFFVKK